MTNWGIFAAMEKWKQDQVYSAASEEAAQIFDRQVSSVQDIMGTPGYQEIVQFFLRAEQSAVDRALGVQGVAADEARIKAQVCREFLSFLKSRQNTKKSLAENEKASNG